MIGFLVSRCRLGTVVCGSAVALALSGCVLNGSGGGTGQPSGNTRATLMITADNNAQIPIVHFDLASVTLVKADGTSVPLLTTPQMVELGSLNGVARPLVTATVPQGSYTGVEMAYGASTFVVIDESCGPGTTEIGHYNFGATSSQPLTSKVNFSSGLTVTGNAMGLLLNLNIPKSLTYTPFCNGSNSNTQPGGGDTDFVPSYSLTGVKIAAQPSTMKDGMVEDVHGLVTVNSAGLLTIVSEDGVTLSFDTSVATVFAPNFATEDPGEYSYVDVDAALQTDGSMLATRVQTEGTAAYDMVGLIGEYHSQYPYITNTGREQMGPNLPNGTGFYYDGLSLGTFTQFAIGWPNGTPPSGLPFTPMFNANSLATGQNVATPPDDYPDIGVVNPTVQRVTLEPQTIDATVMGVASANGVTTYEVTLFPNDMTAILGPTSDVTVYATAATHTITTTPLAGGMVGRFRGLLFSDGGTLKMVAREVEDGVPGS